MTADEMRNNCEHLAQLTTHLQDALDELADLNEEEGLFKWELSIFPALQQMVTLKVKCFLL